MSRDHPTLYNFNVRRALRVIVAPCEAISVEYVTDVRTPGMYLVPEHMCRRGLLGISGMYSALTKIDMNDHDLDDVELVLQLECWNQFDHLVFPICAQNVFMPDGFTVIQFAADVYVPTEEDAILLGLMEKTL